MTSLLETQRTECFVGPALAVQTVAGSDISECPYKFGELHNTIQRQVQPRCRANGLIESSPSTCQGSDARSRGKGPMLDRPWKGQFWLPTFQGSDSLRQKESKDMDRRQLENGKCPLKEWMHSNLKWLTISTSRIWMNCIHRSAA